MFDQNDLLKIAQMKMPFGKYQHQILIDLPEEYLLWFAKREWPSGELGRLLQLCLEIRIAGAEDVIQPLKHPQNRQAER